MLKGAVHALAFLFLAVASLAAAPTYRLTANILLQGDGGWDYAACDPDARRLYLSHDTQTQVLDMDSLKLIGSVPGTHGVHGIALAPTLGRGFISSGKDNQVVVFDLKTLKVLSVSDTEENPDAIVYDPASQRVFAFNGRSGTASVLDAQTGAAVKTIPLDGKPEFAVADGKGGIFVNLENKNLLLKIDSRVLSVQERWPTAPCEAPSALAMDRDTGRLFAGCGNKTAVVMNAESGNVITSLPIGAHVDAAAFDSKTELVFFSNGDGTLTVIHEDSPDKFSVVQTVPTENGARIVALDESTHRLFLPLARRGAAPRPTKKEPHPRPSVIPGTFHVLVVSPEE